MACRAFREEEAGCRLESAPRTARARQDLAGLPGEAWRAEPSNDPSAARRALARCVEAQRGERSRRVEAHSTYNESCPGNSRTSIPATAHAWSTSAARSRP